MSTINVNSISALEDLEASLARFSSGVKETIESANRQIGKKTELLNQIVAERQRAVARLQSFSDDSDEEEDNDLIQRKLAEAEEELRDAKKWQRTVEEVCADYRRHMKKVVHLSDKHADQARLFLRSRIEQLYDYVAVDPDFSFGHPAGNGGAGPVASTSEASDLTSLPLPKGFAWVRFDELMSDELRDLPSDSDYRKDDLTKADMQDGLGLLATRILPKIQTDPTGATLDYFSDVDVAEKHWGKNSLANLFTAFFGDDRVRVSRAEGESHFRIENGRHRIKAALDLGWNALPGEIVAGPGSGDQT
jgi:hypothetical protein